MPLWSFSPIAGAAATRSGSPSPAGSARKGYRVVLYDQRGHGASTRGTAPLAIETLAHDLAVVLDATDVRDAVLAGHSMGGMTIMSLATHRPDVLRERAKATVLVATAATSVGDRSGQSARLASAMVASPVVTRAMRAKNGHFFVRYAFGDSPVRAHVDLTRDLFGGCHGTVRGDFLLAFATMDLLEGIATIDVPTTVMVGSRDALTLPRKAEQIVATVPGARLVILQNRGHMLPLGGSRRCHRRDREGREGLITPPGRDSGSGGGISQGSPLIFSAGARSGRVGTQRPFPAG